jgi:thiamine-monophosphate kinase
MMDLSDGLSTDLDRLTAASGVGARVWADRIPRVTIPAGLSKRLPGLNADPVQMTLHGGEDYELLFTVPRQKVKLLSRAPEFSEITAMGEITRERRILLVEADGKARRLAPQGWDSFRKP